jgi:hypothetical protein
VLQERSRKPESKGKGSKPFQTPAEAFTLTGSPTYISLNIPRLNAPLTRHWALEQMLSSSLDLVGSFSGRFQVASQTSAELGRREILDDISDRFVDN